MSTSEANVSIDFLSNPDNTLDALADIEQGLLKVQQRMGMMNSQFQRLAKNLPSAEISKRFDAMAAASGRFTAKMTASAQAANQLTASAGKTAALEQALTTVAQTLQTVTANATQAGRTLDWMARQAKQGASAGTKATNRAMPAFPSADGGGSMAGGIGIGALLGRYAGPAAGIAAIGLAIRDTIKDAMAFEQAMAGVAAVGEIDKASSAFNKLRDAALSGSNAFSGVEKAAGLRELIAAGMSAEQATSSLASTLRLAAAGEIEMGRASEIMVASMSAFQLKASDSARIIDTLTAAANASPASIDDMGESMKFIAPVASALKVPIETVSAALAVLANNGVRGGLAGRGLGAVFARLIAPTKDAEEAMASAGIAAYELSPKLNSVESVMKKLAMLDQSVLVKLFGAENLDISSILAANASSFGAMEAKMKDAAGAGIRFEQAIGDTTSGSVKKLGNAIDDLQVKLGSISNGPIKGTFNWLTDAVNNAGEAIMMAFNQSNGGALTNLKALEEQFKAIGDSVGNAKTAGDLQKNADAIDQFQKVLGRTQSGLSASVEPGTVALFQSLADKAAALQSSLGGIVENNAAADRISRWSTVDARSRILMGRPQSAAPGIDKGFDPSKWNPSTAFKDEKQIEKEKKQAEARMDLARQVALAEAEAAGDTSGASKIEREIALLREKKAIIENTGASDAEATVIANRLLTARGSKSGPSFAGVADSMQAIGGGGGFFAGRQDPAELQRMQLNSLQSIAENTAKTAAVLGTSSSPGSAGGSFDKAMLDALKTIAQNTGKGGGVLKVTTS
jgi:TP901 family phage tail tape measure protein